MHSIDDSTPMPPLASQRAPQAPVPALLPGGGELEAQIELQAAKERPAPWRQHELDTIGQWFQQMESERIHAILVATALLYGRSALATACLLRRRYGLTVRLCVVTAAQAEIDRMALLPAKSHTGGGK